MQGATRFSNRVDAYVKYRPGYPEKLFDHLAAAVGLARDWRVADIGSGTGISTEMLLKRGCEVYAVEPNEPMRRAAERLLERYPNFHSVAGTAESTNLPGACVDLIVGAQAFHWFDPPRARAEFTRIGKPGAWTALIWNDRRIDNSAFAVAYEALLHERGIDYDRVNHRNVGDPQIAAFFAPRQFFTATFENRQEFDWEGLYGRAMSSSYVPARDHPGHAAFVAGLRTVYANHAVRGLVSLEYDTRLYYGQLA